MRSWRLLLSTDARNGAPEMEWLESPTHEREPIMSNPILESTLTCPRCGHAKLERMPTDACQWFYECEGCHTLLRPLPGDCCVFCSYGTVNCPPMQASATGCCG